jgi:hypothetical protein
MCSDRGGDVDGDHFDWRCEGLTGQEKFFDVSQFSQPRQLKKQGAK